PYIYALCIWARRWELDGVMHDAAAILVGRNPALTRCGYMIYGKTAICTLCTLCRSSQINILHPLPVPRSGSITLIGFWYCGCRFLSCLFSISAEALLLVSRQWFATIWSEGA